MTGRMLGAAAAALLLGACGAENAADEGAALVQVRSSALNWSGDAATVVTLSVTKPSGLVETRPLVGDGAHTWTGAFDRLQVGTYQFCASATASGDLQFGPTCQTVVIQKNTMASVSLLLQQATAPGTVKTDSPLITAVVISDAAPYYGEPITLHAEATEAGAKHALRYAWAAACSDGSATVDTLGDANQQTVTLTSDCHAAESVALTVTDVDQNISSVIQFELTYRAQGTNVGVTLNRWPDITGFASPDAQLNPGDRTTISVAASDADDANLTYAWTAACGGNEKSDVFDAPDQATTGFYANPATGVTGDCIATVTVSDGHGGSAEGSIVIHVSEPSVQTSVTFEPGVPAYWSPENLAEIVSGNGVAGPTDHYARLANKRDGYTDAVGYGDGGFSFMAGKGFASGGDFFQAIDVWIDTSWATTAPGAEGFWIDMTPNHLDPDNWAAEHNFHLTATGSQVDVGIDGQGVKGSITKSGWYTFLMTFRKGATADAPALTDMIVLDAKIQAKVLEVKGVPAATSATNTFRSSDLAGSGYIWITMWKNGFADDTLYIDNVRAGALP